MSGIDQRGILRVRLIGAGILLFTAVLTGSMGYYLLGNGQWTAEEVLYFTVITLSTVGFGETLPGMDTVEYSRLWTIALIVFGSGTLLYFISTFTAFIVEGDLQGAIQRNRMQNRIDKTRDHYIICGVGSTGVHVVEELLKTHVDFVIVDRDEERIGSLVKRFSSHKLRYVLGDATDDEVLQQAGIARAVGIIASLTDDKANLFITLTAYQSQRARADSGAFRIIAKAVDPSARSKLLAAGAHRVVSPSQIGGVRMASEVLRPAVLEFLDLMLSDPDKNLRIEELVISKGSKLIGMRLQETKIRTISNVLVLAARSAGDAPQYVYNPGPNLKIVQDMTLIVLAETTEMNRLREAFEHGRL